MQNVLTAKSLGQFEAIRLFSERASTATQNFKMTDESAAAIAQICRRLDGMPLAIELAASKVRTLSVGQIAQRLDDRFDLLTGGSRMALPRNQTLQAAIEWSYNLLAPAEQIPFRRLSVFVGGWTLEAAEAVCSDQEATMQGMLSSQDILALLTQLVNKSLVTMEERNGEVRYYLLETIRQYAHKELLRSGDENQMQTYHLEFFAKFSEDAEPRLLGKDQLIWLDRLEQEIDNIRAALDWSVKSRNIVTGLRLAGALWRFWDVRNCSREGRGRLLEILSLPEAMARTKERAKALHAAGTLSHTLSDHAAAGSLLLEGLAISKELQDKHATGYFLIDLAHTWGRYRGDMDDLGLVDQSLEIFKEFGDRWGIALSLEEKGRIAFEKDDLTTAISYRAESIRIYRELGDQISLSLALIGLANLIMYQRNYGQSGKLYDESLALFKQMRHRRGISISINGLGEVARCQENFSQAKALYEESLGIARELGDQARMTISFHNLGYISQHQGDYQQAIALFMESLLLAQEIEDKVMTALCMIGMAGQLQAMGYPIQAAHLFGAAQPIFDFTSNRFAHPDQLEYQRNLREARAQLDEATFASAWEVGSKMTVNEALDLVSKTMEAM